MQKLKLTFWTGGSEPGLANTYLGVAYDHKSFAAMEKAVRSGCFGPMSKSTFFYEYVTDTLRKERMFRRNGSRLEAVIPVDVAINWQPTKGKKSARKKRTPGYAIFDRTYTPDLFKALWREVWDGMCPCLFGDGLDRHAIVSVELNANSEIRLQFSTGDLVVVGKMGAGHETFVSYLSSAVSGMLQ
jgi:hypothetical protein